MTATSSAPTLRTISAHRTLRQQASEIWQYRELLAGLIGKELKVRYKNSVLGFLWSMVQPVFLLIVYSIVFSILGAGFDQFAIWLLCGLIVWTLVSTALTTSAQSVTANAYLVSKVAFPRAILPLATLGSALVHFFLQLGTFAVILVIVQHGVAVEYLWLLPLAVIALALFCAALGMLLSVLNVYARDTQHLLDLLIMAWFWATPVVYQYQRAAVWFDGEGLPKWLPLVNPVTSVVITFQRAIYGVTSVGDTALLPDESVWWYLRNLGVVAGGSALLLLVAMWAFDRAEGNFAEVL